MTAKRSTEAEARLLKQVAALKKKLAFEKRIARRAIMDWEHNAGLLQGLSESKMAAERELDIERRRKDAMNPSVLEAWRKALQKEKRLSGRLTKQRDNWRRLAEPSFQRVIAQTLREAVHNVTAKK